MYLMGKPENVNDRNFFKVIMPALHRIQPAMRDLATSATQTVRDIAGETIGRVPARLNQVFRTFVDQNFPLTSDIYVMYLGRYSADKLDCMYHLSLPVRRFRDAMKIFEDNLTVNELDKLHC